MENCVDDLKIYRRLKDQRACRILKDIEMLYEWNQKWFLEFSNDKCKLMHLGRQKLGSEYHITDATLGTASEEKDLGIYNMPSLKMSKVAAKTNSLLRRIRSTFTNMDINVSGPLLN